MLTQNNSEHLNATIKITHRATVSISIRRRRLRLYPLKPQSACARSPLHTLIIILLYRYTLFPLHNYPHHPQFLSLETAVCFSGYTLHIHRGRGAKTSVLIRSTAILVYTIFARDMSRPHRASAVS